ncbi:hypothetical protein HYY75_05935, partial [bacterium]|nr:hypothetical protein [bacterium]
HILIRGNIEDAFSPDDERKPETPRTVFSLVSRKGGIIFDSTAGGVNLVKIEGSVYTDKGIAITGGKSMNIVGNWVTNAFSKALTQGEIVIDYTAYKTRSSLNSINPEKGKFDPERYHITLAPGWANWRVQ